MKLPILQGASFEVAVFDFQVWSRIDSEIARASRVWLDLVRTVSRSVGNGGFIKCPKYSDNVPQHWKPHFLHALLSQVP